MGRAMLSKSLNQFSIDGRGCVPSLLFDLRPNYGGRNEDNGNLLQKVPCTHCHTQCPQPCSRPPPTHNSTGNSWTLIGVCVFLFWHHCSFFLGLGVHKILFVPSKSLLPQFCSNYRTIVLISQASKVMLKILQARLQQYVNFQMFKLDLEKAEKSEIKSPTSTGSLKKQERSRKTSTSALLTTPKPFTVWITTTVENSERDGNTRPPELPPEKSVCQSGSNS